LAGSVTLIFTNSFDLTTDRLVRHLGVDRVFRFNFDLWREYSIRIEPGTFMIQNPTGREVRQAEVAKLFWRKPISRYRLPPFSSVPPETLYLEEEVFYAIREIKNLLWRDGKVVLIEPAAYQRIGKLVQMEIARRHFAVPAYTFSHNMLGRWHPGRMRVAKSLTSERVTDTTFLWTTPIAEDRLDPDTPWFLQDLVAARWDITVVFVRGRLFAFSLERERFVDKTVDWRELGPMASPLWAVHDLPPALATAIAAYMDELGLHYGRLDFLYDGTNYWFLEVNANGEWGWLDPQGDRGVLAAILEDLDPDTPVHSIPVSPSANCVGVLAHKVMPDG
jgi:hypothetical protein